MTTRTPPGSPSATSSRMISSSAESRRGVGAWATAITVERIGGEGGFSNTTVTSAPLCGRPALEHVHELRHRRVAIPPPLVGPGPDHVHAVDEPAHDARASAGRRSSPGSPSGGPRGLLEAVIAPEQLPGDDHRGDPDDARAWAPSVAARSAALTAASSSAAWSSSAGIPRRGRPPSAPRAPPRSAPSQEGRAASRPARTRCSSPRLSAKVIARATWRSFVGHGSGQVIGPRPYSRRAALALAHLLLAAARPGPRICARAALNMPPRNSGLPVRLREQPADALGGEPRVRRHRAEVEDRRAAGHGPSLRIGGGRSGPGAAPAPRGHAAASGEVGCRA